MDLMAKICSAQSEADLGIFYDHLNKAFDKPIRVTGISLRDFLRTNRYSLFEKDFLYLLNRLCKEIAMSISEHQNTFHTQVVVAGGFSAGKSSFLNMLTNCSDLLPTGVEPVSVVKTYLYCSRAHQQVRVKGVNLKNILVNLPTGVLEAIQHGEESNVYLASVLEKLFVEIPSENLDGLVFIDTPGYNNSDKVNSFSGKSDKEVAAEALGEGNVLFWIIDSNNGTITKDDIDVIKRFKGKKLIIFNKADNVGIDVSKDNVDAAARLVAKEMNADDVIDIIAYSVLDKKIYYSKKKRKKLDSIIKAVRCSGCGTTKLCMLTDTVEKLFDRELEACRADIESIKGKYIGIVEKKEELYKTFLQAKKDKEDLMLALEQVLIDNYNGMADTVDKYEYCSDELKKTFANLYDGVVSYYNNCSYFNKSKNLLNVINNAGDSSRYVSAKYNGINKYCPYSEDFREKLIKYVEKSEDDAIRFRQDVYDRVCELCKKELERKQNKERAINAISEYKTIFMAELKSGINDYRAHVKAADTKNGNDSGMNIFESILNDDYKAFLHCFEKGVNTSLCNTDGYSPLTLAASMGNNQMVKFMLANGFDAEAYDGRGYNVLQTAVECQYKDICEIVLEYSKSALFTQTRSGESVECLAGRNKEKFYEWIKEKINETGMNEDDADDDIII